MCTLILTLMGSSTAFGQEPARGKPRTQESGSYPRLPGAISAAPPWLGAEAPFDVAKFFASVPRDRNAAPLYLDALFEFGAELAGCFPEGPKTEERRQAAMDRSKRFSELMTPFYNQAGSEVPPAVAAEVVGLYEVGLRKLASAQRRDRCVFETGFGVDALLPHVQVGRQVARVVSLRVQQSVQRGDIDAAIGDVDMLLRMVRDYQMRGVMITQLVRSAVEQFIGFSMVSAILSSSKLRPKDCDGLLKILTAHDQKSMDGYAEALRADCIGGRATIRDLVLHQRELAARLKIKPGDPVLKSLLKNILGGRDVGDMVPEDADARVAQTSPAELTRRERDIDRYYRAALALDGLPAAEVLTKIASMKRIDGRDPLSVFTANMISVEVLEALIRATSRARTTLHANECLVSVRRWQLTHRGSPRSLLIAVKDAGLKSVPSDPYDGKPLRLITKDGEPVVYSVGRDGKDDGGQKDSKNDALNSGDLLYRLPAVEENRKIRPS
jgi:hypothetical protein